MTGVVVADANLLVLLVVGSASKDLIAKHKRLSGYTVYDFKILEALIGDFTDLVLLPHILTETSNLARQIDNPARAKVQAALGRLIASAPELPIQSVFGAQHSEFARVGLTDAVVLHLCAMTIDGLAPTLITVDTELANIALSQGYSVIDYKADFQS